VTFVPAGTGVALAVRVTVQGGIRVRVTSFPVREVVTTGTLRRKLYQYVPDWSRKSRSYVVFGAATIE
jgi:hypothetical protein